MNYNKGFSFSSLFLDKTNRSRFILFLYFLVFIILIIFLRLGLKNSNNTIVNNNLNEDLNNSVEDNNVIEDNNDNNSSNSNVNKMFSYIDMNNYEFNYILYYNDDIYTANGKRFDRKYSFEFSDGENVLDYLASGAVVKVKDNTADSDSSYTTTVFPYFCIDYFDNSVLKNILDNSKQISFDEYEITNEELLKFIDNDKYNISLNEEKLKLVNKIKLNTKNNIIVGIDMDITNMFSFSEEINSLKISLKYMNFGLVDDFDVIF